MSHYYTTTGEPRYFVPKKDGSGNRPTTIRDARENQWLPSVTEILKILDKPALTDWKVRTAVMAVVTAPDLPGEAIDAKVTRVLDTERQQDQESQKARDRGTEIHDAMEAYWLGKPIPESLRPWVGPAIEALSRYGSLVAAELCLVGDGYAGKTDLILEAPDCFWIFDYKTSKTLPQKSAWQDAKLQLAAYAKAWEDKTVRPVRVANCYISTRDIGEFKIFETENWRTEFENGFRPLLTVWQHLNGYHPRQNSIDEPRSQSAILDMASQTR